jgi:hypothetical protein
MSERSSIKAALVDLMNAEMNKDNEGTVYYNDMDKAVLKDNLYLDTIDTFPAITVALGPERFEYHPSRFAWVFLTVHLRCFVKSEDETEEQLEHLIADIKTFVDKFDTLPYNVTKPDGSIEEKSITQITLQSITTDEGILKPLGLGEVSLEIRYQTRR